MEASAAAAATDRSLSARAIAFVQRQKTSGAWVFAVVVSIAVTLLGLGNTYSGFFADAAWTWAALGLVVTNIVATLIIIALLQYLLQPQRRWLFVAVVAASIQVLVNSEYQTGIIGADSATEVEQLETFSVGKFYNPLAERLNTSIDTSVRIAQRKHLAPLIAAYPAPEGATKLYGFFVEELEASRWPVERQEAFKQEVKTIVDDPNRTVRQKVRALGMKTYPVFGKKQIADFVRLARSP